MSVLSVLTNDFPSKPKFEKILDILFIYNNSTLIHTLINHWVFSPELKKAFFYLVYFIYLYFDIFFKLTVLFHATPSQVFFLFLSNIFF